MALTARRSGRWAISVPGALASLAALLALGPIAGVVAAALSGDTADIALRDVLRYAATSACLAFLVGLATAILGTVAAWLVVMHRFPGRDVFAWALALPLAAPVFGLAYAYADLFDVAGVLRTAMRGKLGFDLPLRMRSIGGAAFVLTCAFYPYVFLAMRAAFLAQSINVLEASRLLGCDAVQALWRVALPMARPPLAAGVALAVMETLADYGAVRFLSVQTLTTGVVRAWSVFGSTGSAARLALPLLAAAALLLWVERRSRVGQTYEPGNARWRPLTVERLSGGRAWLAAAFCFLLLFASLLLPMGWLALNALDARPDWPRLLRAAAHSLGLGGVGAVVTVTLATMLAVGARRARLAARLASVGYATPGAVMALGLLAPASLVWGIAGGSGTLIGLSLLIYAYAARLMAAALEPINAGLARVTPSMMQAARTLGRGESGTAVAIQLPVASGAMLTAGLIVFVDVLKELPATLILRPFNFDTLAIVASNYALDERLAQAGAPSLLIILLALPPVVWLTRKVALARPGA